MSKLLTLWLAITFVLFTFIIANNTFAQQELTDVQNNIRYNKKTNLPAAIYNVNSRQYSGTPEEIARQYLFENKTLFGLKDNLDDIKIEEVKVSPSGKHVGFIISLAETLVDNTKKGRVVPELSIEAVAFIERS